MRKVLMILFVCSMLPYSALAASASNAYGTYGLFPQGSSRVMAMGGAFAAISDDVTGVIFNPAGPALAKWSIDLGGTNNHVNNQEVTPPGSSTAIGVPYDFRFYGAAARAGNWVFTLGYSSPFHLSQQYDTFSGAGINIILEGVDGAIARRFGEHFAVGLAAHSETLTEEYYQASSPSLDLLSKAADTYYSGGVTFKDRNYGIGVAYVQGRKLTIDYSLNQQIPFNGSFFQNAVIPAKTTAGIFYRWNDKVTVVFDVDSIAAVDNAIFFTDIAQNSAVYGIDAKVQNIYHGGFEWTLLDNTGTRVVWRLGGYQEPARGSAAQPRTHFTFGLEVRLGPAVLNVAFDQSSGFSNTAQGFSVSAGDI